MPVGERATHYIHPYPAKLLPHIPAFFLGATLLSKPGDVVLDPFCGSGTVLLESVLHGRHAVGADANPLARLIASAKTSRCTSETLLRHHQKIVSRTSQFRTAETPDVVNIEYWFYPHVIRQLARLRRAIDVIADRDVGDFFRVCFSACVRRVSLADPRLSVPVRQKENQYPAGHGLRDSSNSRLRRLRRQDVISEFSAIVEANLSRLTALRRMRVAGGSASVIATDARSLTSSLHGNTPLPSDSVDLIITSPPYAGAQKYVRASSLSIGWLGLAEGRTFREIEDENIGREHFTTHGNIEIPATGLPDADRRLAGITSRNPLRALIAATYLTEMRSALAEAVRVLRPGGHMVLVAANNRVCGAHFHTQRYLQTYLEDLGLVVKLRMVDAIKSRGLMTRRNTTSGVISREWVVLFQKKSEA